MGTPATIRIGTSGWVYRHWRGVFYPPRLATARWFGFYSAAFATVEINNTFYRLPAPSVFDAWRQQAPPGFVYTIKASRFLTHQKKLKDPVGPLELLMERAHHLGPHLGPILYQLPPWHCDIGRLRDFVAALPSCFRHVLEFRDPSWYTEEVHSLLTHANVGFCIHDLKGEPCPQWVTAPFAYLRFHGPTKTAYVGRYERDHLRYRADEIEWYRDQGLDVYAYFNNDPEGHAVANARELCDMLHIGHAVTVG